MSAHKVSVRETRQSLQRLLDDELGSEVVALRRGVEVARFIRPERKVPSLPDLSGFRASIKLRGTPLSQCIQEARRSSRY
jgi:hypothetical protein